MCPSGYPGLEFQSLRTQYQTARNAYFGLFLFRSSMLLYMCALAVYCYPPIGDGDGDNDLEVVLMCFADQRTLNTARKNVKKRRLT